MAQEATAEKLPVTVQISYKDDNPDYPELNFYTEAALLSVPADQLQEWEEQGEAPINARLVRFRRESKFPAGFISDYRIVSENLGLMRVVEILTNRHHELFRDFLKSSWARMTPGLPPNNDFPLRFPAQS